MKSTSRMFLGLATACGVCLLGSVMTARQAPPQDTPLLAEQYFKNVQVLKGLPVDEFLDTMGMFAAATGFPLVIKPAAGAGASGAERVNGPDELEAAHAPAVG